MRACGVPTAGYVRFHDREEAAAHLACASYPAVLKADVLAAGKGVIIVETEREAREALDVFFAEKRFGETEVILEEFLEGEELSLLALCDGERALPLAPAQDYKRIYDGDKGPNTGGMGSYSPVPGIDDDRARELARPASTSRSWTSCAAAGRRSTGPVRGSDDDRGRAEGAGVQLPLRDPETQAVLPRLRSDLVELLEAATRPGGLARVEPEWSPDWSVTVVLASRGYPASSSNGRRDRRTDGRPPPAPRCSMRAPRSGRRDRDRGRAGAGVTALGRHAGGGAREGVRRGRADPLRGRQLRTDIAARAVDRVEA